MTDTDISEVWEALNRVSEAINQLSDALKVAAVRVSSMDERISYMDDRLMRIESAKAMQQGAVGNAGYSDVSVVFAAPPNAPGLDTHDSGRVKYGAGMITY